MSGAIADWHGREGFMGTREYLQGRILRVSRLALAAVRGWFAACGMPHGSCTGRVMSKAECPELTPDHAAAHEFLSELRTRISTQPLPYQYGVEARALESLWEVFGQARAAMKNHPGCGEFARRTTTMLNVDLRPVTAKWHRAHTEGRLNSRDGANEFREDLANAQLRLRAFALDLQKMAYGTLTEDALTPGPMTQAELDRCLAALPFGITKNALISDATVEGINTDEAAAVAARRANYHIDTKGDGVGLALSGGGIRSATFCLGVNQVLADRDLLKHVDFLFNGVGRRLRRLVPD